MPVGEDNSDEPSGAGRQNRIDVSLGSPDQGRPPLSTLGVDDHPGVGTVKGHRAGVGSPDQLYIRHTLKTCHLDAPRGRGCG